MAETAAAFPWSRRGADELIIRVRLTPKSSRDEIGGIDRLSDGRTILKVRVRALPENGEANEALLRLVAKTLRTPAASVRLESGGGSRLKTLSVTGDAEALQAALARMSGHAD
ncbi:DUF167 family protein [Methylocapsa aurea]|uniref:DUF167 family protein n=1 Tax=Methylocapsa aurea TaxID=663610 RepID=UPI0005679597|nr:DUF167 family protein [Methylocapsa aurea]